MINKILISVIAIFSMTFSAIGDGNCTCDTNPSYSNYVPTATITGISPYCGFIPSIQGNATAPDWWTGTTYLGDIAHPCRDDLCNAFEGPAEAKAIPVCEDLTTIEMLLYTICLGIAYEEYKEDVDCLIDELLVEMNGDAEIVYPPNLSYSDIRFERPSHFPSDSAWCDYYVDKLEDRMDILYEAYCLRVDNCVSEHCTATPSDRISLVVNDHVTFLVDHFDNEMNHNFIIRAVEAGITYNDYMYVITDRFINNEIEIYTLIDILNFLEVYYV